MSQTSPDESGCEVGEDTATTTTSAQHLGEPAFDLSEHDQPGPADSQNQSQDLDETKSQEAEDLPTVENDIAAALGTDLDLSDAVALEEVPAVSLEEQVASALERASTSLPHLSSASCSLESFKSGTASSGNVCSILVDSLAGFNGKVPADDSAQILMASKYLRRFRYLV